VGTSELNLTEKRRRRADKADLLYVNSMENGIRRIRCGRGFTYRSASGKSVLDKRVKRRIDSLVIPPGWDDVVICAEPRGHLQAVGRDDAGRRQYIYHPRWHAISNATKYERMHHFAEVLPRIRRRVRRDLRKRDLSLNTVLAAVVRLIDKGHLRVGNRWYCEQNGSHGATTLYPEHVEIDRKKVELQFPGKRGKHRQVTLNDPKLAMVLRQCEEIDGQFLFQYQNSDGEFEAIDSTQVNRYLQRVCQSVVTAKDFRTWWGTTIALAELTESIEQSSNGLSARQITRAVKKTAEALGNTMAVCRKSYIHPAILNAAESNELQTLLQKTKVRPRRELTSDECGLASILPRLDLA